MIKTITVQFEIDTDDYDDDEFGEDPEDVGPEDFINLAKEMLDGDADYPEKGYIIKCDEVSRRFTNV